MALEDRRQIFRRRHIDAQYAPYLGGSRLTRFDEMEFEVTLVLVSVTVSLMQSNLEGNSQTSQIKLGVVG